MFTSAHVNAEKLDFLKNSILGEFNQADVSSFRKTTLNTLESIDDGVVIQWKGETGIKGKLQAQFSYQSNKTPCRRVRFAFQNDSKRTEAYKFDICKMQDKWEISSTPATHFTNDDWKRFQDELTYSLNHVSDDNPMSWVEKKSGVSGVFVPLSTTTKDGQVCRDIAISIIDSKGRTSDGHYQFLLQADKTWVRVQQHTACQH